MAINFTKLQSAGNDFVLVEAGGGRQDWPRTAAAICQRNYGIGADGLLLLGKSSTADLSMRIFNADGSEAEPGIAAVEITLALETNRDELDIKIITDYPLTVDDSDLKLAFVSMGNPHAVYFWNYPVEDFSLGRLGPDIERHQLFPNRVNFEVAHVISRREIEVRVWERGVGETLACGTGACAVAVAAQLLGYVDKKVDIKLPGGTLEVEWDGEGEVYLSGPAEIVFSGEWPDKQREDLVI